MLIIEKNLLTLPLLIYCSCCKNLYSKQYLKISAYANGGHCPSPWLSSHKLHHERKLLGAFVFSASHLPPTPKEIFFKFWGICIPQNITLTVCKYAVANFVCSGFSIFFLLLDFKTQFGMLFLFLGPYGKCRTLK